MADSRAREREEVDPRTRSRAENEKELLFLQRLIKKLPEEKRAAQAPGIKKRMKELSDAIEGSSGGGLVDNLAKGMLWLTVGLALLGAGFFGIMTLARM